MLRLPQPVRVFAARSPVNFNFGIDRLVGIVRDSFGEDPFTGDLFCFFNRGRNRVKILVWDRNGFWLLYKRLERGSFERIAGNAPHVEINREELVMLLEGIDTRTRRFGRYFPRDVRISRRDGCARERATE